MKLRSALMISIILALTLSGAVSAAANIFAVSVAPGLAPQTWVYTLYNNDTSPYTYPVSLSLDWDDGQHYTLFSTIGTPKGWYPDNSSDVPFWNAAATNQPLPGHQLGGFMISLTYSGTPPPMNYTTCYDTFIGIGDIRSESGHVVTVIPTPEPGSLATLGIGLLGLGVYIKRRRSN